MDSKNRYEITWLIRRLFRAMAVLADEGLRAYGITAADRAVLEFLYPDETLSVPEIAVRYDVSRQHVQATVNRLRAKGLVEATQNPRHKRSPLIVLTRAGATLFAKVRSSDEGLVDQLFEGIPEANQKATRRTLRRLLDRMNEGEAE